MMNIRKALMISFISFAFLVTGCSSKGIDSVQQIADEAVDAVNEAKNKEGETSDLQSTKYAISYKADSSNGADMARAVLDEIMDG